MPPSVCPIPEEQQPVQEYQQLRESWLFTWVTLPLPVYIRKLFWVWLWGWLLSGPISAASFSPEISPLKFGVWGSLGAGLFVAFVVARMYLGWTYVNNRLTAESVIYEESGWYDGQRWEKPEAILQREKLMAAYQVRPLLLRLQQTAGVLVGLALGLGGLYWLSGRFG
ncbi:MAG: CGLD27 family protein [Cyanobacteria bacterium P01_H01_bin.15]